MSLCGTFRDQLLNISRQSVIGSLAANHVQRVQQMVGLDDIALGLIELVGHNQIIGILLSVQSALFQRHIQLTEIGGRGVSPKCLPVGDVIGVLHCADLDTREVRHLADSLVAGHNAETGVSVAEQL